MVGGNPGFVRNPSPGTDGVWGTEDDDYGDLRLLATSPARDAGNTTLLPADEYDLDGDEDTTEPLPIDLAGSPRIRNAVVDLGAYEFILLGDANDDNRVDGADLAIWQQHYDPVGENPNTFEMGDFDEDGDVDGADLALWQQNYDPVGSRKPEKDRNSGNSSSAVEPVSVETEGKTGTGSCERGPLAVLSSQEVPVPALRGDPVRVPVFDDEISPGRQYTIATGRVHTGSDEQQVEAALVDDVEDIWLLSQLEVPGP
jgi:hypothetical protein